MTIADDDLARGLALIQQLSRTSDPVEQDRVEDEVRECGERLAEGGRYDDALSLLDRLLTWQTTGDAGEVEARAEGIAQTMLDRVRMLHKLDRLPEALTQCDDLLQRFGARDDPSLPVLAGFVADALYWKGETLLRLERWLEALVVLDAVVAAQEADPESSSVLVGWARRDRGRALSELGDFAGAATAYAEGMAALADSDDPEIVSLVEIMMNEQAVALVRANQPDKAIPVLNSLIAVLDPANPPYVAGAYYLKALVLLDRRQYEEAITVADEAAERFGSSDIKEVRWAIASCLDTKIKALTGLGRKEAAAHVAEQLVDLFGADLDPLIEGVVAPHAHRLGRGRSRLRFLGLG